ncbi:alpha-ketoacid dehydrogenase subunit beta [Mesorhizobium sp. M7A.F.Ca.CA.002.15.2.1]|uniref:alpha-ketoacid dehydrogenase subunit beta n=1 Tax=Mesorhizobium sp. M7A.F.Ca.CA.002.15.2.1 TaxID=2496678 RepID=UPI000FC9CCED|nr:alpha-ketoacid dehydrogenase subunit beta [Mesorhizobium sp. M7A.F.Ca.CA.002.15.2.1]RVC10997.1 alpha-ketoacid dehydrogenase subunit beta [Mesorhizobium sp. M7A.F.Ca.CA.002.15.2.1]
MAMMRYAEALNAALREEMQADPSVFVFGEDIGRYGGVFKVTKGLMEEFGETRVRDTPISEQALTAMAVTAAMTGTRPVLEIMYADFVPLTLDALVNQASIYNYIWNGQVKMPFVLRTQGGGGAGAGAQHSKSLDSMLAHIPGIKVVAPSTPADAKGMLKAAIRDDQPVVFLEHKLLYKMKGPVPEGYYTVPIGKADIRREGRDLTIVATSIMVQKALDAAAVLESEGIDVEVVDLRTIRPMDKQTVIDSVKKTSRLLCVYEAVKTLGIGAEVSAMIAESEAFDYLDAPIVRLGGAETPIPYNPELEKATVPQIPDIITAARDLVKGVR